MKRLLCFSILAVVAAGCATNSMKSLKVEPIHFTAADLSITLTYITAEELKTLHGTNSAYSRVNPYTDFPGLITPKRFLVFNFVASTTASTIEFALRESHLAITGISGSAKSQGYLTKLWEIQTNQEGMEKMTYTMKKTILPREFTVSPDNPVEGYLIFGDNYPPEGGEAVITFSVGSRDGSTGLLEIPINLEADAVLSEDKNTGIFSNSP